MRVYVRRFVCWLLGHSPVGPPYYSPVCARCGLVLRPDTLPWGSEGDDVWENDPAVLAAQGEVSPREGIVTAYDSDGRYVGCIGRETWAALISAGERPVGTGPTAADLGAKVREGILDLAAGYPHDDAVEDRGDCPGCDVNALLQTVAALVALADSYRGLLRELLTADENEPLTPSYYEAVRDVLAGGAGDE